MIIESAVLVVGDEKQHFVPLRAGSQRLVNFLDELLALGDVVGWVVVVRGHVCQVEVALLHNDEVGELPCHCVDLEPVVGVESVDVF